MIGQQMPWSGHVEEEAAHLFSGHPDPRCGRKGWGEVEARARAKARASVRGFDERLMVPQCYASKPLSPSRRVTALFRRGKV